MAGGKNNIHNHPKANTNGFDKCPENIYRGDKKKSNALVLFNDEMKSLGYKPAKPSDVIEAFGYLSGIRADQVMEISKNPANAGLIYVMARMMLSADRHRVIERMLDRYMGKVTAKIDVTTGGDKITISNEELQSKIEQLDALLKDGK